MPAQHPESYFMTTKDQDAVVGRLMREQREMQQKLAALAAEAKRIGFKLVALGKTLSESPGRIVLEGESVPDKLRLTAYVIQQSELDEIGKIPTLTADYRQTVSQLKEHDKLLGMMKGEAGEIDTGRP